MDKVPGGSVTRTVTYYPVAGPMRINNTLYYTLKDRLGSASVVTDASGVTVGEQGYYPYGETRVTSGTIYTDKLFTGQREMGGLGIYHYGARFYSPKLGRFLSADTIVPGATNPQAYNRYSYVLNNPLKYIDPSGHGQCRTQEECEEMGTTPMGTGGNGGGGGDGGRDGCRHNDPDCRGNDGKRGDLKAGGGGHPLLTLSNDNSCSSYDPFCANVSGQVLEDYLHNVFEPYQNGLIVALVVVPIVGGIGLSACLHTWGGGCVLAGVAAVVEIWLGLEAIEAGQISSHLYSELGNLGPNETTAVSLVSDSNAIFELNTSNVSYGTDINLPINASILGNAINDWRTGIYIFP